MVCKRDEDGLSEVIGFILILALIMIFLSIWVIYAVPAEGRQQEIEQMDYVQNWFTQYKINLDSLWINYDPDVGLSPAEITVSNSLTLGSQGGATHSQGLFLIFMRPFGSSGTISLENGTENIVIKDSSGTITVADESLVRVQYKASNTYWISQTYYYQMGGVFLEQSDGTINRVAPLIRFYSDGGSVTANVVIPVIDLSESGTNSISGEGPVRIDTVLRDRTSEQFVSDNPTLEMTLDDDSAAKAWVSILKELGGVSSNVTRNENIVTVSNLSKIQYQFANYTVSLQSIAAAYSG